MSIDTNKSYYLGIDIGGTMLKIALFSDDMQEIAVASSPTELISKQANYAERDMNELWDKSIVLIKEVLQKSAIDSELITAISISAHGKGLYLVDKDHNPVGNAFLSADNRAIDIVQQWQKDGINDKLYKITMQPTWSAHPIAQLKWLQINEPETLAKTAHVLMAHDFIRLKLTDTVTAEETNMGSSGLVNIHTNDYDDEVLELTGLQDLKSKLPPIVSSTTNVGCVSAKVAEQTGLSTKTKVFGGFFDVVAASIGSGVLNPDVLSATMGTWSITTTVLDKLTQTDYKYVWAKYCVDNTYFIHEASPTSASNLAWFITDVFKDDIGTLLDKVNTELTNNFNFDNELIFFPFLFMSNTDKPLPSSLIGMTASTTKTDIVQAIYEGILFSHMQHLQKILDINTTVNDIVITGGPTKSDVLMQMFANLSGKKIIINKEAEVGAKGVCMCCAVGLNPDVSFSELAKKHVNYGKEFSPDGKHTEYLQNKYKKYQKLIQVLSEV